MRALWALGFTLVVVGCKAPGPPSGEPVLRINAPARLLQAVTSTNSELCERLAVDLTLKEQSAPGAVVDRVRLTPTGTCTWALDENQQDDILLARGVYSMLVRLTTNGAYPGQGDCQQAGADPVWVGAYFLADVPFPFEQGFAGFTEAGFLSRPDDDGALVTIQNAMGLSTPSFDVDGDGFDNLVEVAGSSNACVPNQPPVLGLDPDVTDVLERDPIVFDVRTNEPGGLQHDVVLELVHPHGAEIAPEKVELILRPYDEENPTVPQPLPAQSWSFEVEAIGAGGPDGGPVGVDESPTSGRWQVTFIPDEPFVGRLSARILSREKGGSSALGGGPDPLELMVENVLDPVRILVEDEGGTLIPVSQLEFAEQNADGFPTTLRMRAESQDIGLEVSGELSLVSGPPGLVEGADLSFTTLSWLPTNTDFLDTPEGGYPVELSFVADDGETLNETLPAVVRPTFNDPPLWVDLATANRNLSPAEFEAKRFRFDIIDPDRVSGGLDEEPNCVVTVTPTNDSACTSACCQNAWSQIECGTDGPIDVDVWHLVATLTPSATYFADCGEEPSFTAQIDVTDVPPPGASPPGGVTISTVDDCPGAPDAFCQEHVLLETAEVTQGFVVGGWPTNFELRDSLNGTTAPLIDGVAGTAVLGVYGTPGEGSSEARVAVIDLSEPPTMVRLFEKTELNRMRGFLAAFPTGVVDLINHRAVFYGSVDNSTSVMASVDTEAPYDVTTWPIEEFCSGCPGFECGASPVVDEGGTVWVPCGRYGSGSLVRLLADGTFEEKDLAPDIDADSGRPGAAVLVDDQGGEWLLWPDRLGVALVELSTFDDAAPNVVRLTMPPSYDDFYLEGHAVSHDRTEAYLAYNHATAMGTDLAEILRIRVGAGAGEVSAPIVFGDESVTNNGGIFHRLVLREPDPTAPPEAPDLVITGSYSGQWARPMIDTDSWTLVEFPRPVEDYQMGSLIEVYPSPDPAYFVGISNGSDINGTILFPWDLAQTPLVQDIGVPGSGNIRQSWIQFDANRNVVVVNRGDDVSVIEFLAAP